jgi:hypothetical protein
VGPGQLAERALVVRPGLLQQRRFLTTLAHHGLGKTHHDLLG